MPHFKAISPLVPEKLFDFFTYMGVVAILVKRQDSLNIFSFSSILEALYEILLQLAF